MVQGVLWVEVRRPRQCSHTYILWGSWVALSLCMFRTGCDSFYCLHMWYSHRNLNKQQLLNDWQANMSDQNLSNRHNCFPWYENCMFSIFVFCQICSSSYPFMWTCGSCWEIAAPLCNALCLHDLWESRCLFPAETQTDFTNEFILAGLKCVFD